MAASDDSESRGCVYKAKDRASDHRARDICLVFCRSCDGSGMSQKHAGSESVPKIIINDTVKIGQHFGNFKQQQFPSAV